MSLPFKEFTLGASAATAFIAIQTAKESQGSSTPYSYFAAIFVGTWMAQLLIWGVYVVLLYPLLLSPLRGLPEPEGSHWLHGQWKAIDKEPTGVPMRNWYVSS
jgi:hypothetical protein